MVKLRKKETVRASDMTPKQRLRAYALYALGVAWMVLSYYGIEYYASRYLDPVHTSGKTFGLLWALLLSAVALLLPRLAGRIFYGVTYFAFAAWSIGQCGYYSIFGRMMWFGDIRYAGEGGAFVTDVLSMFAPKWIATSILLLLLGVIGVVLVRRGMPPERMRALCLLTGISAAVGLFAYPTAALREDPSVWGVQDEYRRALSKEAAYTTMYDAHKLYRVCGIYQSTVKDIWQHNIYPKTPMYHSQIERRAAELDGWFAERKPHADNDMSGIFKGKNVVLVLMESMDDWVINEQDTPMISKMMHEGINFTNFYTPGYGSVRTFNTEFCVNTGGFMPTNGQYAFDYCTNDFSRSLPSIFREMGYSAQSFHYNSPLFYNRGLMEPAVGYEAYNSFLDFGLTGDELLSDAAFFENDGLMDKFYHGEEGGSYNGFFNFIISRSAHMTYSYDEELSVFALGQYPEYKGSSGDEEVDCMRAKAHTCDDLFAALYKSLEESGHLEDTVIVGFTDHYAYGMQDQTLMMELSNVPRYLMVERTPCFIWSADGPTMEVNKLLNTSDLLPTLLNLFGIESDYHYLGQDAFDENYEGYVVFQDQAWISNSGVYDEGEVIHQFTAEGPSEEEINRMNDLAQTYIHMNNLLLESDYYGRQNAEK